MSRATQVVLSAVVGILHAPLWLWLWFHFISVTPHLAWLVDLGLGGPAIRGVSSAVDLFVNVVLALLPAFALVKINENRRLGSLVAVASWISALTVLTRSGFLVNILTTPSTFMLVAAIPIAVWVVGSLIERRPNNSFKPNPLRGTA